MTARDARITMNLLLFGPFRLDKAAYSLTECIAGGVDRPVALRPKTFDILRYLVDHPGHVVSQDEFLSELWRETYVQPEVLKGHILAARNALGDRGSPARYIETVRGRGYRFIAAVRTVQDEAAPNCVASSDCLVGRAAAQQELELALSRARSGETQIAFVTGEAGIGKTSLGEAFEEIAVAQDVQVVTGRCLPGSGETDAYYPLLEMLTALSNGSSRDTLLDALTRLAPTWLVQLPALMLSKPSDVLSHVIDATPHRMARELCDVLDSLTRSRCLLLFLEDIHWSDRATLDLIFALANRRMRAKLMIVATLRTSVCDEAGYAARILAQKLSLYRLAREIKLQPLSYNDVKAFLGRFAQADPPAMLTTHLHDHSEGNPLFMRAILDLLLQRDLVSWDQSGWRLDAGFESLRHCAPPNLLEIIEAEISALPLQTQCVLEAASVSHGPFSPAVHHVASPLDEQSFEAVCETMSRRGQLIRRGETIEMPDGRLIQSFSFRHVLFQEVACDRQGAARRTKSHAAVAERLGNIFAAHLALVASALAYHYVHAGLWPQAIRFLRMTARTAMQRFALREASTLLEQAIQLCRNLPTNERGLTELELLEELAHIYLGRFDLRAEAAYQRLTRLAHDVGRVDVEARAMIGLGYFISWTDRDRSLDVMSCALSRSTAVVDPVQRARIRCSAHGWRSWAQGWNAGDADGFEVAIEELRNLGDPVALAASQVEHSLILFPSARYMEATDSVDIGFATLLEHVLDAWVDLSLPLWMIRLGPPWALMSAGRFGDALERFASGFAAFENNGDVRRGATLRLYHAFVFERMHDHQAALNILDDTVARIKEGNISFSPNEVTIELVIRGLAQLGLGQVEIALEHLKAARAEMDARDTLTSWYWRLAGEWGMTDALLLTGDLVEAEACAHKFQERACAIEERSWRALAAEACARVALAAENPMRARTYLAQAWGEIKGYDAALVRWRLYSVDASISDKFADTQSASRHRKSQADELEALAASLPTNHASRDLLLMAQPISSSSAALCPQTSVGEALRSMTDGLPPLLGQNVDARPLA